MHISRIIAGTIGLTALTIAPQFNAQISLNSADLPQGGMTYNRANANPSLEDFSITGANMAWDFGNLQSIGDTETAYHAMSDASFTIAFVFSNADHYTSFDLPEFEGFEIPISGATIISEYSSSAYSTVGIGISIESLDLPVAYNDADATLPLPLTFGASLNDDSELALDIPSQIYFASNLNRDVTVDGWGTLTLPGGTFEVLRVKTIISGTDSLNFPAQEIGFSIPDNRVIYAWYAAGEGLPVLSITEIADAPIIISFKEGSPTVGLAQMSNTPKNLQVVGPIPARDFVQLSGVHAGQLIDVVDATGRLSAQLTVGSDGQVNISGMPSGTYVLSASDNASGSAARLVVE
ncbi:MAG: T9SS type A sorting domain-containing protein [Flavobacteriales bacterium]|nr:T9SS type A sorting domain-containing protein [Flavobacteriales bacterium]